MRNVHNVCESALCKDNLLSKEKVRSLSRSRRLVRAPTMLPTRCELAALLVAQPYFSGIGTERQRRKGEEESRAAATQHNGRAHSSAERTALRGPCFSYPLFLSLEGSILNPLPTPPWAPQKYKTNLYTIVLAPLGMEPNTGLNVP